MLRPALDHLQFMSWCSTVFNSLVNTILSLLLIILSETDLLGLIFCITYAIIYFLYIVIVYLLVKVFIKSSINEKKTLITLTFINTFFAFGVGVFSGGNVSGELYLFIHFIFPFIVIIACVVTKTSK